MFYPAFLAFLVVVYLVFRAVKKYYADLELDKKADEARQLKKLKVCCAWARSLN